MEKRVLLAFILATVILAAWYYFFMPKPQPLKPGQGEVSTEQQAKEATPTEPAPHAIQAQQPPAEAQRVAVELPQIPEREIRIETPLWRATFTNRGAVARSWTITQLPDGKKIVGDDRRELELIPQLSEVVEKLGRPFRVGSKAEAITRDLQQRTYALSTEDSVIRIGKNESRELAFTYHDEQARLEVTKKFTFHGNRYDFELSIDAKQDGRPLELELLLGPSFGDQSIKKIDSYTKTPPIGIAHGEKKAERIQANKIPNQPLTGSIRWTGVEDNYFALVLIPQKPLDHVRMVGSSVKEKLDDEEIERHFIAAAAPVSSDQVYTVFAGPKDRSYLRSLDQRLGGVNLESIINYGYFASVVKPIIDWILVPALNVVYRFTRNYGVAIILITLVVNMFFFPLRRRSTIKMRKASALQPRVREIQQKMKQLKRNDPKMQELQMEQLKLMREANPFSGCLPMLIQLPIFWAFFVLLTVSLDVRQAHFCGWIDDLSSPDRWHVLPIAMCASMIASSIMMPSPTANDPSQRFQKIMMAYLMPILLTFLFFWRAPSGLVLYWMFSNLVSISQQYFINRLIPSSATVQSEGEKKRKQTPKPAVSA